MSFDALILAAGMGERLRPLTLHTPKPLIPILGVRLIDYALRQVLATSPRRIFINGYNLKDQIQDYCLRMSGVYDIEIIFLPEDRIQGSGGPIKRVFRDFDSEEILVHNADLIHDIHVSHVLHPEISSGSIACLVMSPHNIDRDRPVYVTNQRVSGFGSKDRVYPGEPMTFTGVYKVSKHLKSFLPDAESFSIIDCFKTAMSSGHEIRASVMEPSQLWFDLGTASSFLSAQKTLLSDTPLLERIGWVDLVSSRDPAKYQRISAGKIEKLNNIEIIGPALILSSVVSGTGKIGPNVVISDSNLRLQGEQIADTMISNFNGAISSIDPPLRSGVCHGKAVLNV